MAGPSLRGLVSLRKPGHQIKISAALIGIRKFWLEPDDVQFAQAPMACFDSAARAAAMTLVALPPSAAIP